MRHRKILLYDLAQSEHLCEQLREMLTAEFDVQRESEATFEQASCEKSFAASLSDFRPQLVFVFLSKTLLKSPDVVFGALGVEKLKTPCIFVVEDGEPDELLTLLRLGAVDFVTAPLKAANILPRVWCLLEGTRREQTMPERLKEKIGLRKLIGESPAFLAETKKVPLVARCDACVLLAGETGTGKELYARSIHYLSARQHKPFIPVNCGAIPFELVENELFGHERGAFTGASEARPGLLQEAEGGTLFLDEVDCLPLLAQVKLLRFLQEKEYRPLGSNKTLRADVRVIGASNVDFEEAVKAGKLRKDLYYRLNVIRLTLPPLRERLGDIPLLARHFLKKFTHEFNKTPAEIPAETLELMLHYDWPGNVRELENVVERAVVLSENGVLEPENFHLVGAQPPASIESFRQAKTKTVAQFEKDYIQRLLLAYGGNITKAAQAADKNRRAFWELIRKHRIDVNSYKSFA
ncbi:MAG TPA: sigma-54 dependent transcriptional regulator [Pyrinomonadaceae bacterium]|nr:sigma-54 dependent transcriptional regulator [Pyrinomonadaceae bacterium]